MRPTASPTTTPTAMVWSLRAATRHYGETVRAALDASGLAEFPDRGIWATAAIARQPQSASELVRTLRITKQSVSQIVEALVLGGHIERRPDPDDRRRTVLRVTARGRRTARIIDAACVDAERQLTERIGSADMAHLARILDRIATGD